MCLCGLCKVKVCYVCVGFVMCGCMYLWNVKTCGFVNVCVGFLIFGCVYAWFL